MWWENEFARVRGRALFLGGKQATRLAGQYGTPLLVYGRAQILANYQNLRRAFSSCHPLELRIGYAMKANPNPEILRLLRGRDSWIDAVSPGEVEAALRAGFAGNKILFTGTSVSIEDLRRVFRYDGVTVNIDALEQLELMGEAKRKWSKKRTVKVAVRWNPGIGRGFNPRVVTAGKTAPDGTPVKFGVEGKKVPEAFARALAYGFQPTGLHQHLGSGWSAEDYNDVRAAVDKMVEMASRLEKAGFPLEFLDFGGGFGPRYSWGQALFPLPRYAAYISRRIARAGLGIQAVIVEPGKYLVADAGVLLLRVEYIKESYGQLFACVNGGTYNSLPRPAIYPQAYHEIVHCSRIGAGMTKLITVAGNLCETGDVFGRKLRLPVPRRGDILAVLCAGAYGRSMASNFNLREIPAEIFL